MTYEELLGTVSDKLPVIETDLFERTGLQGLYKDGYIFIDKSMPNYKKLEILAEEQAHYDSSVGVIVDESHKEHAKQEIEARNIALELLVSPKKLVECYECGLVEPWEVADHIGISTSFLQSALHHYKEKYGLVFWYKEYQFVFISDLALDIKKFA